MLKPSNALQSLYYVVPPKRDTIPRDVATVETWGEFRAGTIVRIAALIAPVWYVFGPRSVVAVARMTGAPLDAGQHVDYVVTGEDDGFVSVVSDTGANAFVSVWESGYALNFSPNC